MRVISPGFCRAIKRTEAVDINERVATDNTCPEASVCIIAASKQFTVFNRNIVQSGSARKLTGNHTRLFHGIDVSLGKTHIVNPAIAVKLLDKAVPESFDGMTTAIILTNKRVGFVANRTGQVTGINIDTLAIITIKRTGRITPDFFQHAAISHLNPALMIRRWRSTNYPQARGGTQPDSGFGQLAVAGCPVPCFFLRLRMVLVVPVHGFFCSQCSETAAKPAGNCTEVRPPPDAGNNIRRQTGTNTGHLGCQLSTLQQGVAAFFRRVSTERGKLHLYGARGIIRMECFEERDNTDSYADPGTLA